MKLNKVKILISIFFLAFMWFVSMMTILIFIFLVAKEGKSEPKEVLVEVVTPMTDKNALITAFIAKESNGDDMAVGKTNDVGCLQITPILLKHANQIVGYDKYTLNDRYSRVKSIEIFTVIMDSINPTYDLHKACKIWNPRAKLSYHNDVERLYNEQIK